MTRQVAGDAASVLSQSLISAQFPAPPDGEDRVTFLRRLATDLRARGIASLEDLERQDAGASDAPSRGLSSPQTGSDSSHGRAMVTPRPRRKVRREMGWAIF